MMLFLPSSDPAYGSSSAHAHMWLVGLVFISIEQPEDGPGTGGKGQLVAPLTDEEGTREEQTDQRDFGSPEGGSMSVGRKGERWLALVLGHHTKRNLSCKGLAVPADTIGGRGGGG